MKTTRNITIGGRIFAIEDDAYVRLESYLAEVRNVFNNYTDPQEIVADMEDRMADHFEQHHANRERYITLADVEQLIATMGSPEDLRRTSDGSSIHNQSPNSDYMPRATRKLYRNPDDKIIFGVCSGLAAYFGMDVVFVRLLFVVITLMGGSGILLYLILFIIMPEAKTTTEKMAMRGEPITLSGVIEQIKSEFSSRGKK
jgi:phage shock protein PspC (stress-responsive transcriptional regulator)